MSKTRLSINRIEHKSGPTLFRFRANKHGASGHVAPHPATIVETTTSEDRKVSTYNMMICKKLLMHFLSIL